MVSAVLHNACLRMEEQGVDVDDIVTPKGLHRWLGRSGIALGGAASILVGAVFGGILEGIPVLLPPPAVAASAPLPSGTGLPLSAVNPFSLAASVPAAPALPAAALPVSVPDPGTLVPAPGTNTGGGGSGSCGTCGSTSTPIGQLPVGNLPGGGTTTGSGGTTTTTTPPSTGGSTLLQTVTGVVSSPTSVVSDPVGTVTNVVQGVEGTTSTLTSPTTSTSTSPTSTITSTVTTTTNTVTSTAGSLGL